MMSKVGKHSSKIQTHGGWVSRATVGIGLVIQQCIMHMYTWSDRPYYLGDGIAEPRHT
jgi:hypothetical protein